MKFPCLLILPALLAVSVAHAGGNHAGGHGHADATVYGQPGDAAKVTRTIQVDMSDTMRFTPADIRVKKGETIRFVVKNSGQLRHEFSLGTRQELEEHYEQMKKFPHMVHDEPNKVTVDPGQSGEVVWHFTRTGAVDFACLHPGHYDAGMKGQVRVSGK